MAMTRSRTIPVDLWGDRRWLALDPMVRMTSIGLYGYADDRGRGSVTPLLIKADIYPLNEDVRASTIEDHMLALAGAGFLDLYTVADELFFAIVRWPRVDHPKESEIPPPPPIETDSGSDPDSFPVVGGEGRGRAREGVEGGRPGGPWEGPSGSDLDPNDAPSPFCTRHPNGTDQPCRACGTARLRHSKFWQEYRKQEAAADPA
jgi:hypothetical protein